MYWNSVRPPRSASGVVLSNKNWFDTTSVALCRAAAKFGKFKVDMIAGNVKKIWLLARRGSLEATMSYYLVERIKAQPNIEVLTRSEVTALEGCDGNLETARWRHCGRPKAAAFSTSARWSAVGTYSAGISRSVSLN
jgi:hypothetical protein